MQVTFYRSGMGDFMAEDFDKATVVCMRCNVPPIAKAIVQKCATCGEDCWLSLSMIADQEKAGREIEVCCVVCVGKRIEEEKAENGEVRFHQPGEAQIADIAKTLGMPKEMAEERAAQMNEVYQKLFKVE